MRLANICTIDEANMFLERYLPVYTKRFAVKACKSDDLHRVIPNGLDLDSILCIKTERALRNDFTVAHDKKLYQILDNVRTKKVVKILFVYPNLNTELRIPLAISILISAIRNAGHYVKLFDTTFMSDFRTDNELMERMGTHLPTNLNELVGKVKYVNIKNELKNVIAEYKPDIICTSIVERNFSTAKNLLEDIDVPVLAGGIMPSIAPDYMIDQDWIDYICVGEGELALIDLLNNKTPLTENIWAKEMANKFRPLINMDNVPDQDWTDFDTRHLLKPFMGKVYRAGAFEFSRGCYKSCTFCVAPKLRHMADGLGQYHRTKTPARCIDEIEKKINEYGLQMVSFGDTDFLNSVGTNTITEFLNLYINRINVPFTIQSSIETLLDEEILKLLRHAKCCAVSVGIESGSEKIRRQVIKKSVPFDLMKKACDLCRTNEIRITANYMVGLPYETEDDIRQTIELNKLLNPPSIAVTYFTPFMGTELYDICVKEGFYKPFTENVYEYPPLEMPQITQMRIKELVGEFTSVFKQQKKDFSIL